MIQKSSNILLIILFLLAIFIPPVTTMVTQDAKWSETEKRVLNVLPNLPQSKSEVEAFPHGFEKYFNDHFGFREFFIHRYHKELKKWFGIAGTSIVLQGKGRWLFYTGNDLLKDFQGEFQLTRKELEQWHTTQQQRYLWLQKRGIHYVSFSPPNKQSIYPEFMPEGFLDLKGKSRMDQLHNYLRTHPLPPYINIRESIRDAKRIRKLYFELDSHWNLYGAYIAFQKVMSHVQQLFPQESFTTEFDFHRNPKRSFGGDLATMNMVSRRVSEPVAKLRKKKRCGQVDVFTLPLSGLGTKKYEKPILTKCPEASLRAVVFADSFITNIKPFFSENFSEILYLRKPYDQANIEELLETFRPDIIMEERVERNIFRTKTSPIDISNNQ